MEYLYSALMGYFVGCFNPSYIVARCNGVNIKKSGSGNAGASNVVILFGKALGVICALADIFKAFFVILLARHFFPGFTQALAVSGSFCIIGHIFPFYMKFKGGKGLACLGGMILAFDWRIFLIMLGCEIMFVLIVDYICFVPMSASVIFTVIYGMITKDWVGTVVLSAVALVILCKHFENIKRIFEGREAHFSFLWKKEEKERMKNHIKKN